MPLRTAPYVLALEYSKQNRVASFTSSALLALSRVGLFRFMLPLAALFGGVAHAEQFTFVTDPVTTDTPPFIQLLGINNAGTIVGYTGIGMVNNDGTVTDPNRGLILNLPNTFTSLNPNFDPATCLTCQAQVFGIDAAGNTTDGFYIDALGGMHGFLDVGNGPTAQPVDFGGGVGDQLLGLNQSGTMAAGFSQLANGNTVAYTYVPATNNFSVLPTAANGPAAGDSYVATGVNDSGWVTGFDSTTGTGFLFDATTASYVPIDVPGAVFTQPLSLNDAGMVVGTFADANGVSHGFTWSNGAFTIVDPNGSTATVLQGINDSDQIVGFYTNTANDTIGLELTSVPEPSTFGLIGIGMGLLALIRIHRRRSRLLV